MGCSSNKDAKSLLTLPESKISSSLSIKCKICYTNYDLQSTQPMVIPCGHTLCKNCLSNMPKAECPYDRIKFDKAKCTKNYEILEILEGDSFQQKRKFENFTQKIVCKKKHETKWSGVEQICTVCEESGPGFKCQKCAYNRCNKCFQRKPTKICYNGHKTKWSGNKARCVKCRKNTVGWQCLECLYCYCHECSKTEVENGFCPNGHLTQWDPVMSSKHNCIQCGQIRQGFVCQECKYVVCKKCLKYQFINTQCPNSHLTTWISSPIGKMGRLKCQNCSKQSHGFCCEICMFLICTDCCKWKFCYNNQGCSFCPNNHQAVWKNKVQICQNCKTNEADGFSCSAPQCKFQLCRPCSKLRPVTRACFNRHNTIWKKQKNKCLSCSYVQSGWHCDQCDSFFCSQCTSTIFIGALCPNFHKKVWSSQEKQCEICLEANHGWQCSKCKIFTCSLCQKTNLSKDCPNKHELEISDEDVLCVSCSSIKPGWKCKECSYLSCFDCLKGRINSVSCPFYHQIQNIHHQQGMKCKRCKQEFKKYKSCQNKCLLLCEKCITKK